MPYPKAEKIIGQIWQNAQTDPSLQLYAILDAARDTRIHSRLSESEVDVLSLFKGTQARELSSVAPYLVSLNRDDPFVEWLFTYGWGKSWGIAFESRETLRELKKNLMRLITVYDPEGEPLFFRYYDPGVFRTYLPTCNESELGTVFGPVHSYYVEWMEPDSLIQYSLSDRKLVERKVELL